jgi:cellulose synthase/poly-beta-1,6-N-acetylglucosamine synthase-like glycosyltransferase
LYSISPSTSRSAPTARAAGAPAVSVVIPTYNRACTLADTLDALAAQDYPPELLEIVVVDNSSTDSTEQVVRTAAQHSPFPVRYFRKDNRGPAAARNYGIARCQGDVLAFTDSDCTVPATWVQSAVQLLEPGVGLVTGPIHGVVHPRRRPGFFQHQIPDQRKEHPTYPSANVFYRRALVEQVGGLDERFGAFAWGPPVGGEDTYLAWQIKRAGYRSAWAEGAVVYHEATGLTALEWFGDTLRLQIVPRLVALLPEVRRGLFWRYFVGPEHPISYLALVGGAAAAATRRPRFLVLTLPWLWLVLRPVRGDVWPPPRWPRIPLKVALSGARFLAVAVILLLSSIRHRRLVL